ncbi:hypothetical protein V6Z11_A07G145200 [Gossypium hirsutum]
MSTLAVEVSGEKVKAMWDKRLTKIFCDIFIKEIMKGNRLGTHFTKDGWLKIMTNFEIETGKAYSQRQLKNRVGKRYINNSKYFCFFLINEVVPGAQKFKTLGIDLEFEGKLDQMFIGIVATSDKAWAPFSGTLHSDFFEDVNNEILEENEEKIQKRKTPKISSSHFKTGKKKSSKQIGGAARLSNQIEKLCNVADNMSQAISSLTPVMDPYGIPQVVKDKRIMLSSINPKIRVLWLKIEMEDS